MKDDLSDARAAVAWGESQLPILAGRIRGWEATDLQVVAVDHESQPSKKLAVVRIKQPLPDIIHAEVGAIIGSFRSSLDLLCAALALRKGIRPSEDTYFPIFRSVLDMIDPREGIENKQRRRWLSDSECKILKSYEPYQGGNDLLWSLHRLDIMRKHERMIAATFYVQSLSVFGRGMAYRDTRDFPYLKHETVLFEFPINVPQPEVNFSIDIIFDEAGLSVNQRPLLVTLIDFARMATDIIERFDSP